MAPVVYVRHSVLAIHNHGCQHCALTHTILVEYGASTFVVDTKRSLWVQTCTKYNISDLQVFTRGKLMSLTHTTATPSPLVSDVQVMIRVERVSH